MYRAGPEGIREEGHLAGVQEGTESAFGRLGHEHLHRHRLATIPATGQHMRHQAVSKIGFDPVVAC